MSLIYRIQNEKGRGPFVPGFSQSWVVPRLDHNNLPPWFLEFGDVRSLLTPNYHIGVGCATIEQLQRWFIPKEYQTLLQHGYQAVTLEADRFLAQSNIQTVFERKLPLQAKVVPFDLYNSNI